MTLVGIALLALALVGFATSSREEGQEGSIWLDVLLLALVAVSTSKRKSDDDEDC